MAGWEANTRQGRLDLGSKITSVVPVGTSNLNRPNPTTEVVGYFRKYTESRLPICVSSVKICGKKVPAEKIYPPRLCV